MMPVVALALGAVYCLGLAPFDFWPATFIAVGALYWLLSERNLSPLATLWWFGLGKYGVGASWVYVSIHVYGHAPWWLAGGLVVLFVALLTVLFVLPVGWLYRRFNSDDGSNGGSRKWWSVMTFTWAWMLLDWLQTWFLTGFPWAFPGYAVMGTPLVNFAPVVGVIGVSALTVFSATCLVAALTAFARKTRWQTKTTWVGAALTPWLVGWGLSLIQWAHPTATHSVAFVQGNIPQSTKWDPGMASAILDKYVTLSEASWDVDLLVWPEAAVTFYAEQIQSTLEQLDARGRHTQTSLITGIPGAERESDGGFKIFSMSIGLGLAQGRFAKEHLVPFGEYVPFEDVLRGLIGFFDLPMSSMSPGIAPQRGIVTPMGKIAMAICYEVAYPNSMRLRARDATVLMTISNDTWFGASIGPQQHMQIAQMRAIENARWMLRGTNNGITAIVDHRGKVTQRLPQFEVGVLEGTFETMSGRTLYSRVGDWPAVTLLILGVVALIGWRTRQ